MPYRKTTEDIQHSLIDAGYKLPVFGADGYFGNETKRAASQWIANNGEPAKPPTPTSEPSDDSDGMKLLEQMGVTNLPQWVADQIEHVTLHWDVGNNDFEPGSSTDEAYNYAIDGHGKVHMCEHSPEDQLVVSDHNYAPHTRRANTKNLGIALCGIFGVKVNWRTGRVISHGAFPLTHAQFDAMYKLCAALVMVCPKLEVVSRKRVLTHAEWQPVHGVYQRRKWDIRLFPGEDRIRPALESGDIIRENIRKAMEG